MANRESVITITNEESGDEQDADVRILIVSNSFKFPVTNIAIILNYCKVLW